MVILDILFLTEEQDNTIVEVVNMIGLGCELKYNPHLEFCIITFGDQLAHFSYKCA